jgi:hypothetical protein
MKVSWILVASESVMLVSLTEHCARLIEILSDSEMGDEWIDVVEWLALAATIKKVEVNTIQFDKGFGLCEYADEYSIVRDKLLNGFVSRLSRFSFIWGGLESCINHINPPKHPIKSKRGKIRNACYFLENYFSQKLTPDFLWDEILSFRSAADSCLGYASVERRFQEWSEIGWPGIGLFAVYELRNLFAHGSIKFPEPDEENQPNKDSEIMLTHASRIVLLSIQMLVLADCCYSDVMISCSWNLNGREDLPLSVALSKCHFHPCPEQLEVQMYLEL